MLSEMGWHKPRLNHVYSVSSTRSSPPAPCGEGLLGCSSVASTPLPLLCQRWGNPGVAAEGIHAAGLGEHQPQL